MVTLLLCRQSVVQRQKGKEYVTLLGLASVLHHMVYGSNQIAAPQHPNTLPLPKLFRGWMSPFSHHIFWSPIYLLGDQRNKVPPPRSIYCCIDATLAARAWSSGRLPSRILNSGPVDLESLELAYPPRTTPEFVLKNGWCPLPESKPDLPFQVRFPEIPSRTGHAACGPSVFNPARAVHVLVHTSCVCTLTSSNATLYYVLLVQVCQCIHQQ